MARSGKKITVTVSNDIVTDQRMDRICSSLSNMGFDVEIVGRKLPVSFPLVSRNYRQSRLKLIFKTGPLFYAELNIRLLIYLLACKPDIIYSVDADTAVAGVWTNKLSKSKLIFDAHELFSEVPELQNRGGVKLIWQWIEKLIIKRADLRITVSDSVADYYSSKYNKHFEVIRNVSRAKSFVTKTHTEKFILYQGALNEGRGLGQLIEASKSMDVKIKIAGNGDIEEKLKQQANSTSNTKIEFLGRLLPEELQKVSANAWLGYNLLEKRSLSYYYSLSNKTFDYIQAGITQLMPDFPEYKKLNDELGFGLLLNLNPEELVKAVNALLENPDLYKKLTENSEKASKVLTWENEELKLKRIIKNLI